MPDNPHPLFLFDIDGVLIYPKGYKEALSASVEYFAERMGHERINLTYEEIAVFEACGLTNEWDSLAMCVALMFFNALERHPNQVRNTFELTLDALRRSGSGGARPNFAKTAREVLERNPEAMRPHQTVRDILLERNKDQVVDSLLHELLDDVYVISAPTTRIFQHFTLGSERFEDTYNLSPDFKIASQLLMHDIPHIQSGVLEEFLSRDFDMALYTARPSLPPADLPQTQRDELDSSRYPPEGDLAAGLLGVLDKVPLIAAGRVAWLAQKRGKDLADYMKPSPIQALAAIGAAISAQETAALEAAVALAEEGEVNWPFDQLKDQQTAVVVFEDSVGGIRAVKRATEMLQDAGLDIAAEAVGVARENAKREVLVKVADRVIDDINLGLSPYLMNST